MRRASLKTPTEVDSAFSVPSSASLISYDAVIITDLHLTDNPADEYRWEIWDTARKMLQEYDVENLFILGDMLDKKDRHAAELVNRVTDEVTECARRAQVTILKGNHDYKKERHPFLSFLRHLPNVHFIEEPEIYVGPTLWLPHTRNPKLAWDALDFRSVVTIFMHQSVIGSQVSNYYEMKEGLDLKYLHERGFRGRIYSGDIHLPQVIKHKEIELVYIGTQYPVSFGDEFEPRSLVLKGGKEISVPMNTIKRLSVHISNPKELEDLDLKEDDQMKVTLILDRADFSLWHDYKLEVEEFCLEHGVELHDLKLKKKEIKSRTKLKSGKKNFKTLTPDEVIRQFARAEGLGKDYLKAGLELMKP